ncbi:AlbA family DNA-binding domain-containing protein [Bradyrhizobium sp. USDA 3262]
MLTLDNEAELIALHTGGVKESLHLEYKASDAVNKRDSQKKLEMARDVSAFANADGGQIVYGMTEKDHEPNGLDDGVDPHEYPEIWFEQVLQQYITPKLTNAKPRHVLLSNGRVAVVIDIPAATGDPHQVDNRYYRRHNYNKLAMEHYEVRDMFRRSTYPDLYLEFYFDDLKKKEMLKHIPDADHKPVGLSPVIKNRSNEPALYVVALVYVDARLKVLFDSSYDRLGETDFDGVAVIPYRISFNPNKTMPVFKEQPTLMPALGIVVPEQQLRHDSDYILAYEVRAPGCHKTGSNLLMVEWGKFLVIKPGVAD